MYVYKATVVDHIDGDSIYLDIDLGFDVVLKRQNVRLYGIDTPESRTTELYVKQFGKLSSKITCNLCPIGSIITIHTELDKSGKYGRILGTLITKDNINVNQYLVENHYAVKYKGHSKELIRSEHEQNFEWLIKNNKIEV